MLLQMTEVHNSESYESYFLRHIKMSLPEQNKSFKNEENIIFKMSNATAVLCWHVDVDHSYTFWSGEKNIFCHILNIILFYL